jgi:MinD superfamily P-loop ATPase
LYIIFLVGVQNSSSCSILLRELWNLVSEIAIISGKGGTGKTTIAASFAAIAQNLVIADCDVDAPDLHMLLNPVVKKKTSFQASKVAKINVEKCTECGVCEEYCRFDAAHPPKIDAIACEGCGVCEYVCPEQAIHMVNRVSGHLYQSESRFGPMAHAKLFPGEGNSGKLVTEVRKLGQQIAKTAKSDYVLIDGSPGIGCPVIATVAGIRLGIVVTEPTVTGIHDMERVLTLLERFKTIAKVIINKFDINEENSKKIQKYCENHDVEVLGKLKFDPITTKSMIVAKTLPEFAPKSELTRMLHDIWYKAFEST